MITWMQKHKKYLIITIWISTIAFIAAGMVGWGAYNFSPSSGALASVGKITISPDDLNREYRNLYARYSEQYKAIFGRDLGAEEAKSLGLENQAMQQLIDKALLENFARDSGLRVSDEEVLKAIQEIFTQDSGEAFDAAKYKEILRNNQLRAADFEERVRKDLLIQKILALFPSIVTPFESEILAMPMNLQDRLAIEIIEDSQVRVNISDEELRGFYDNHKDSYKTPKAFEVEMIATNLSDISASESDLQAFYDNNKANYMKDGALVAFESVKDAVSADYKKREAQKIALKAYNDFANGTLRGATETITESSDNAGFIGTIEALKEGEFIKPVLFNDAFVSVKMLRKIPQEIKDFEAAKNEVRADYAPIARKATLERYAQGRVNVFAGRDVGFIGVNDVKPIAGLADFEKQQLLAKVFTSEAANGYIVLGNKAVLYRVLEQKMLENDVANLAHNMKSQLLERTIIDFLAKQYKVVNNFTLTKDS